VVDAPSGASVAGTGEGAIGAPSSGRLDVGTPQLLPGLPGAASMMPRSREPAYTALDPYGKEESSVLFKKSSVVGAWGEVDISAKGNTASSKTTCLEIIMRL
jgi:hypothetical protein